jgi:hypothetical protein
LNEGSGDPSLLDSKYEYKNVKSWSKYCMIGPQC